MVRREVIAAFGIALAALVAAAAEEIPTVFSLSAPQAKEVFVAGEFNHWSKTASPLQRDANGRWSTTISLPPGKHAYKFVVDGEWKVDDANPEQTRDGFGGMNSVVTVADVGVDPVVYEKDDVRRQAMQSLRNRDFAVLEQTASEYRRAKSRFSDGLWKLKELYEGLRPRNEIGEEKDWQLWFEKLEGWHQQFPQSATVPVVVARSWVDYAAHHGADLRRTALTNARSALESAASLPERCPQWFAVLELVAEEMNSDTSDFESLLAEAAAAEPTYYDFYANAAEYYLARAHGKGELDRVAQEAAAKFDPTEGMAAYARTVWFMEPRYRNVFEETTVTWPKLRAGFLDIQQRFPSSRWNANAFCRFAVQAKDRATANLFFAAIGEHGDPDWGGYGRFEMAKLWADPATPSCRVEPMLAIAVPGSASIHSIAFSPDARTIAAGSEDGRVTLWDASSGKERWSEQVAPFPVCSVTFSPDGRLLAAGAGETFDAKRPGVAKVWNFETKEEIATARPKGVVWKVAFTPDGKTLAISGGKWEREAESSLLDLATGALQPLPWTTGHDHMLKGVAISPDGKTLVTDCYQSITVWSLAENRVLFDSKNVLKDFVLFLAFAPDGKTLATCGAPMRGHNDHEPGELTLWDAATWKTITPRAQRDAGGLVSVAWSPDSRLIAGGGYDRAVHVWDARTMDSKAIYIGHDGMIWSLAFSPDGNSIASAGEDGVIKVWRLQ